MQKTQVTKKVADSHLKSNYTGKDHYYDVEDREGDVDPDALAYIKAKRNVDELHKAKKLEKKGVY